MIDLRSRVRRRLLAYSFTNPAARHYLRELAVKLAVDPGNLSRELRRLERDGLFVSEVSGRQKYFRLNRKYPLYEEVRRIVSKTIGAAPRISEALRGIAGLEEAFLYGSFARNQQDAQSDMDILVIGKPEGAALAKEVQKLERYLGREIHYTVLTRKEFEKRWAKKDAFLKDVWGHKRIALVGEAA